MIVVLVDDLGYADFSAYGNARAKTENVDRLAAEGLRFAQYYVNSPICSPSRTALTTGQYPARWRITSYIDNRQMNDRRGMAQFLDPTAPTLARFLSRAGYRTGHFGKWHLGGGRDVGEARSSAPTVSTPRSPSSRVGTPFARLQTRRRHAPHQPNSD